MRRLHTASLSAAVLSVLLSACGGSDKDYDFNKEVVAAPSAAPHGPIFDPANGKIPASNDLLFKDSKDGTLNIPNPSKNPIIAQVNQLDGFSTSNPIIADFGMAVDPASVIVGDSVHIFEITKQGPAITGVVRELSAAEVIVKVVGEGKTLALIPFPPLKESTSYEVVLTNKIKGTDGKPAQSASPYSLSRSKVALTGSDFEALEPLRQHINNMELIAESKGVNPADIVLTWSFTTQSITPVLKGLAASAAAGKIVMAYTGMNTSLLQPAGIDYEGLAFTGAANIHTGTLDIPYYLETPSAKNPTAPLNGYWKGLGGSALTRYNTSPVKNTTLNIPVIMTTPNENSGLTKPASGWPVIMYQHGITRLRTDMLIYADNLAKAGFALIAIDLPLHGVPQTFADGSANPFHASASPYENDTEQTFDVDYMNNTTQAPGPDGKIDSSGAHYINLQSLLTSRDNTRQGVSNLLVLRRSLASIPDIDANNVGFIAHSLGGIVGVTYLGVEPLAIPSALLTTGASISTILRDSKSYGPIIKGGLAASGVKGADYDRFLLGTQWILDSSDPVNYASAAAAMHPIYMSEVIGDGQTHVADTTVPNSSTEILAALMRAQPATEMDNPIAVGSPKIARFIQGDHSSILDPTDDAPAGTTYINVFREMHAQLAEFQTSKGTNVKITDHAIILKQ